LNSFTSGVILMGTVMRSVALLVVAAGVVGFVHSILPDHWVPLAVVGRTQSWSLLRVARISGLAAGGHVLASLVLAGVIALIGLRFQKVIETQQGHIVGGVLVLTGLGFLVWGLTGHGHQHGHDHDDGHEEHEHEEHNHPAGPQVASQESHDHQHAEPMDAGGEHMHEHAHAEEIHSHPHSHEAYIENRQKVLLERSQAPTVAGRLAAIAVPFGVAASPDLTILPVGLAASVYGGGAVTAVLLTFALITMGTFVGLTVVATAAGYQVRGEWLEKNANTITSLVLVAVGVVAFFGF
jgi:nickel/cobalt transporter (NicO) family protein